MPSRTLELIWQLPKLLDDGSIGQSQKDKLSVWQ